MVERIESNYHIGKLAFQAISGMASTFIFNIYHATMHEMNPCCPFRVSKFPFVDGKVFKIFIIF